MSTQNPPLLLPNIRYLPHSPAPSLSPTAIDSNSTSSQSGTQYQPRMNTPWVPPPPIPTEVKAAFGRKEGGKNVAQAMVRGVSLPNKPMPVNMMWSAPSTASYDQPEQSSSSSIRAGFTSSGFSNIPSFHASPNTDTSTYTDAQVYLPSINTVQVHNMTSLDKSRSGGNGVHNSVKVEDRSTTNPTSTIDRWAPPTGHSLPSSTSLGKRKAECPIQQYDFAPLVAKRETSLTPFSEFKPDIPVPMLPLPLPSKRYKKNPTSKALLIPVEQLPVFPLPPLPVIADPELAKHVFTHCSLFEKTRGRFEDPEDSPAQHYEKLEHVGDSILGMVVTTWLHETKPNLTCGTATKLKAHLVSNATLSHLSSLYNLPQRLSGDPNLLPVLRAQTDVRAALMEAYIAALYFSYPIHERFSVALAIIDTWLREMYEPLYDFFYTYMKTEHDQHHSAYPAGEDGTVLTMTEEEMAKIDAASMGMAALLAMYAGKQERELRWEEERYETNIGTLWRIRCCVDGIELGEGTRAVKKQAKNVAGWEAGKLLGLVESPSQGL